MNILSKEDGHTCTRSPQIPKGHRVTGICKFPYMHSGTILCEMLCWSNIGGRGVMKEMGSVFVKRMKNFVGNK
jgi:hypothetical protein